MSRYLDPYFIYVFSGKKESNFIPQPDSTVASLPCIEIFVAKSHTNAKIGTGPLGFADRLAEISIFTLAPPCGSFMK